MVWRKLTGALAFSESYSGIGCVSVVRPGVLEHPRERLRGRDARQRRCDWLIVVSVAEKSGHGLGRVGLREASTREPPMKRRNRIGRCRNRVLSYGSKWNVIPADPAPSISRRNLNVDSGRFIS